MSEMSEQKALSIVLVFEGIEGREEMGFAGAEVLWLLAHLLDYMHDRYPTVVSSAAAAYRAGRILHYMHDQYPTVVERAMEIAMLIDPAKT